ncbi:glycosyltransferase [Flavobacterium acetivorans]|uniref:glycosyltransferase n=1 Tax=Flavobacterium acetivorans TaxID=2893883 RepID=UPI001E5DE0C2|nr:glycosyltransferase [Flavobacterium sp. F-29]UFH35695.1 glycosyltransferase [Flavobacterium sp. F-29]
MRIVQIIDSLEAGGAERMAVNYANALVGEIDFSGLVATRKEGLLRNQVQEGVSYLFLNKKNSLDLAALFRLRAYVKKNKIRIVHAHSSSFFIAALLKLVCPSVQLIWHDHYGNNEFLLERTSFVLKRTLPFFDGIIAVNQKLRSWSEEYLNFKNAICLDNFPSDWNAVSERTSLKGIEGKRIVCLANLRMQKDHFLLLRVAKRMKESHPDWSFHLIGKDFGDAYSEEIKRLLVEYDLEDSVFLYGSREDVSPILRQSTIGVLTSKSEGFPLALLEYGRCKIPVVVTQVGEIPSLVQNNKNGFIVVAQDEELFFGALVQLIENEKLRIDFGNAFYRTVMDKYSTKVVIRHYLNWLQKIAK